MMKIIKAVGVLFLLVILSLGGWIGYNMLRVHPMQAWSDYHNALPPLRAIPKNREYTLRVAYWEDPRLPTLQRSWRNWLYMRMEYLLRKKYGYRVRIVEVEHVPLAAVFERKKDYLESDMIQGYLKTAILKVEGESNQILLLEVIVAAFKGKKMRDIAGYKDLGMKGATLDVDHVRKTFLAKLKTIRSTPLPKGGTFRDPKHPEFTVFNYWSALLTDLRTADFVLTNTVAAGADMTMPIYVIARGGITTGMIQGNRHNKFQAAGYLGLFPYLSDAPFFLEKRGRFQNDRHRLEAIATMWQHELGHFFLRYKEHYGHPNCVHAAAPGLDYIGWHDRIKASKKCPLPHGIVKTY